MIAATIPAPPTASAGSGWIYILLLFGALAAASLAVYKILWPITKAAVQFSATWPILVKLAESAEALSKLAPIADKLVAVPEDIAQIKKDIGTLLAGHRRTRDGEPPDDPQIIGRRHPPDVP